MLNKTQKELADLLGVKQQTISAILTATDVRSSSIERISEALNIPVSYFYGETQSIHVSADNGSAATNEGVAIVNNSNNDVALLKKLLEEKERLIQILLEKK